LPTAELLLDHARQRVDPRIWIQWRRIRSENHWNGRVFRDATGLSANFRGSVHDFPAG
jgi:hypothetical protein